MFEVIFDIQLSYNLTSYRIYVYEILLIYAEILLIYTGDRHGEFRDILYRCI